jgi:hypothetical protein
MPGLGWGHTERAFALKFSSVESRIRGAAALAIGSAQAVRINQPISTN